ncbi:hypothetical protein B0H16DRAFT_1460566 [Mycena metata]|uniref:Uncharacterized protein n=1 Tax=Mycena metata TaxID=1033252 RepID=A0AAD7N930_9AGAR|nr:hypothetical protein B0H16DRAFT_1460566 [Mycena metata]
MYDFPKPPNISNHDGSNVSNDDQSNVPNYSLPFRAPPREPIPLDVNEWGEFASPSVSSSSFSSGSSDPLFHYHARPERSDEALDVPHDVQDMDWEYSEEPILSPLIAAAPSPCSSPIPLLLQDSRESPVHETSGELTSRWSVSTVASFRPALRPQPTSIHRRIGRRFFIGRKKRITNRIRIFDAGCVEAKKKEEGAREARYFGGIWRCGGARRGSRTVEGLNELD